MYCNPLTGGGGGAAGSNPIYGTTSSPLWIHGSGSGGGGGGGVQLRSANNIEITGGQILSEGGDGGPNGTTYNTAPGGAGAGGAILIRSLKDLIASNATISVEGGKGVSSGFYTYYVGGSGDGGDGWIRLEDGDADPDLSQTSIDGASPTTGSFVASGAGAPSIGQTLWMNMGVFDPVFLDSDITEVIPKVGQTIKYEIQATVEDIFDFGMPDVPAASSWIDLADITDLNDNGYSFIRFRVTFTLADDQEIEDPMPSVDLIKIRYEY